MLLVPGIQIDAFGYVCLICIVVILLHCTNCHGGKRRVAGAVGDGQVVGKVELVLGHFFDFFDISETAGAGSSRWH